MFQGHIQLLGWGTSGVRELDVEFLAAARQTARLARVGGCGRHLGHCAVPGGLLSGIRRFVEQFSDQHGLRLVQCSRQWQHAQLHSAQFPDLPMTKMEKGITFRRARQIVSALACVALMASGCSILNTTNNTNNNNGDCNGVGGTNSVNCSSAPANRASAGATTSSASTSPACPHAATTPYAQPTPLPSLKMTSLTFCPVDINDGLPMTDTLSLSGNILGRVPKDDFLALISWPDPSSCSVDGTPGSGIYYLQTELSPRDSDGYWQWKTASAGPGNQTIKRYIYFVLAPQSALAQLQTGPRSLPSDVQELAYVTAQGEIPPGHHCN